MQALDDISRSALCCHSNATCEPIANPPNSAEPPTVPPSYTRVRAVVWACGYGQTDTDTDARDHYTFRVVYDSCDSVASMTSFHDVWHTVCRPLCSVKNSDVDDGQSDVDVVDIRTFSTVRTTTANGRLAHRYPYGSSGIERFVSVRLKVYSQEGRAVAGNHRAMQKVCT